MVVRRRSLVAAALALLVLVVPSSVSAQAPSPGVITGVVIDQTGGVYFTDPDFGAPMPKPQDKLGVYYVAPDGKVTRLIDNLAKPNGVRLSPDEKTLYVFPTGSADMMAYDITAPGQVGKPAQAPQR